MDLGGRATQEAKAEAWMPIRAYRDIFTACFELNSILYYELIGMVAHMRHITFVKINLCADRHNKFY